VLSHGSAPLKLAIELPTDRGQAALRFVEKCRDVSYPHT
jgi:hypothetical protein